jgi:hypothetical protein
MARMMRGEEPFIYDKKVLEEVCWLHAQTYLHISAMDEMSTDTRVVIAIWFREPNTGRGITVQCTPMNKTTLVSLFFQCCGSDTKVSDPA